MTPLARALLTAMAEPGDRRLRGAWTAWRAAGCPGATKGRRGRKPIAPGEVPAWLEPYRDQLGTVPDRVIAEATGRSVVAVRKWRTRLGLDSYREMHPAVPWPERRRSPGRRWPPELLDRLGREPDAALAREYGISRERVRQLRAERGIPLSIEAVRARTAARAERAAAQQRPLPVEARAWFGVVSDAEIARRLRCSTSMVARWRSRYELPGPPAPRKPSRLGAYRDRFGVLLDTEIAGLAGVSYAAVAAYRRVHPDLPRSPRSTGRVVVAGEPTIATFPHPDRAYDLAALLSREFGEARVVRAHPDRLPVVEARYVRGRPVDPPAAPADQALQGPDASRSAGGDGRGFTSPPAGPASDPSEPAEARTTSRGAAGGEPRAGAPPRAGRRRGSASEPRGGA